MGQLVGVVEKQSTLPGVVRFELNRSLSGMGHERFASTVDAIGSTPSAALARQLFATGKVDSVHVYGNMVTVDIGKGYDSAGLADIVREMYRYWKPGVEPPVFEDAPAEEAEAAPGGRWRRRRRWRSAALGGCQADPAGTCSNAVVRRSPSGRPTTRADPRCPWRCERMFDNCVGVVAPLSLASAVTHRHHRP